MAAAAASSAADQIKEIKGVNTLVQKVSVSDVNALRTMGDQLRDKTGGVVVLASVFENGKIGILAMAHKDAVAKGIHCGKIVKEVATICGGGGGGRPDMAHRIWRRPAARTRKKWMKRCRLPGALWKDRLNKLRKMRCFL